MPQKITLTAELSPQQLLAVEQLAIGATVTCAAEAAGVSRETVHRWSREDFTFQAALNRARRDLQDAIERRLLAVAERAMANVADAVEDGNLNVSLSLLKGLGVLGGTSPRPGSDDPQELAEQARFTEEMQRTSRLLAGLR
jgi:hypothetical protein